MENRSPGFSVLYEDNHLLVVSKPAPLPTMGVTDGDSLLDLAKNYLKRKYEKPGNVYLGVVSRLDSFVTGAIVLARTSKAAARLSRQFATAGAVDKTYWAWVAGSPPERGEMTDWVRKNDSRHRMEVGREGDAGCKEARLSFRRLLKHGGASLVEVKLLTGRKHQIRLQFCSRGFPVRGDRKYDSKLRFPAGIALHSRHLTFSHPVREGDVSVTAELPSSWSELPLPS